MKPGLLFLQHKKKTQKTQIMLDFFIYIKQVFKSKNKKKCLYVLLAASLIFGQS